MSTVCIESEYVDQSISKLSDNVGVSREAKKHIKTSTASKGDLQMFIQLALGGAFDPAQPPQLAVPRALSCILKEDVTKAQADTWLRRSNSGAPYFVSPELEEKLLAAGMVREALHMNVQMPCLQEMNVCMPCL